jgi:lipoprotein-anchoring transpeptidase ErfK/SrfK
MSAPTMAPPLAPSSNTGRSRLPIIAGICVAVVVLLAIAMLLYDHSRRDQIAKGVTINGVSVGGLSDAQARTKIERELIARLNRPVRVHSGTHEWTLGPRQAHLTVDANNMIDQAVSASREGSIFSRTFRELSGGSVKHNVPLVISYSHQSIRELTAKVRAAVNRPPRDATVAPSESGLNTVPAQVGLKVNNTRLAERVQRALAATGAHRAVGVPTHSVKPQVTTSELASRYPAYIVVDRATFRLRFYDHLKLSKTYEIAVGMEGLETPGGLHKIEWEQVDPPWYVPDKAWAGALAGTVVPPGPADPLKARFMSFDGGAGIHGVDPSEYSSIGSNASHGCIRMRIPDVIALYDKSPVGTPVYII